jgi:hypothetical protein
VKVRKDSGKPGNQAPQAALVWLFFSRLTVHPPRHTLMRKKLASEAGAAMFFGSCGATRTDRDLVPQSVKECK